MREYLKIGLGLGLLWYGVLRGAKALVVRVQSYSFRTLSLTDGTVSLNLNLLVKNPLFVGVTIKGITGEVYAQGQKIGYVNTNLDYFLGGAKAHIIPVVVNLQFTDVMRAALLNVQSGDVRTLTVAFDGKLFVGQKNIGIPLQFEFDYKDIVS